MLKRGRGAMHADDDDEGVDMSRLWRLATWGGAATLTLAIAVLAVRSETGTERLRRSMAVPATVQPAFDVQAETQRLSQQLRNLIDEREQLLTRLASLERNLKDVTGSVARELRAMRAAAAAAKPPPAAPADAPPKIEPVASAPPMEAPAKLPDDDAAKPASAKPAQSKPAQSKHVMSEPVMPKPVMQKPVTPKPGVAESKAKAGAAVQLPVPRPGPVMTARSTGGPLATVPLTPLAAAPKEPAETGSTALRTEFGVDIGSGATMGALQTQWQTIKRAHPKLLEGMRPIASIRDIAKRKTVELRLVVGPIADASAAAKRCAELVSAGLGSCRTAEFEGQRLAIR